jgi:hypothetical protein
VASYLYSVIFDLTAKSTVQAVFEADDSGGTCGTDHEGNFLGPVNHSFIKTVRFRNVDGSGPLEMWVTVALGKDAMTKAESEACMKHETIVPIPKKDYELQFLFDGRRFNVAPASRTTQKLFPLPSYPMGITY